MDFLENLNLLSVGKIRQNKVCTTKRSMFNEQWYLYRKSVASKTHEVTTKMKKLEKEAGVQ